LHKTQVLLELYTYTRNLTQIKLVQLYPETNI